MITGAPAACPSVVREPNTGERLGDIWTPLGSFSSTVSGSPAALLKLLVLEDEREMSGGPLTSCSLSDGLSLFRISGELGLDDVSDFTSCDR